MNSRNGDDWLKLGGEFAELRVTRPGKSSFWTRCLQVALSRRSMRIGERAGPWRRNPLLYSTMIVVEISRTPTMGSLYLSCVGADEAHEKNGAIAVFRVHVPWHRTDPLGIPGVFLYFLVRQRSRINPPTDKALKDLRGRQHVMVSDDKKRRVGVLQGTGRTHCLQAKNTCLRRLSRSAPWRARQRRTTSRFLLSSLPCCVVAQTRPDTSQSFLPSSRFSPFSAPLLPSGLSPVVSAVHRCSCLIV